MKRYVWIGCAAVAVVAAAIVFTGAVAGQGRERGSREEVERRGGERPEPVVLRFVHIPAKSFMQTLEQLGQYDRLRETLVQMAVALNEPANAVVIIAPPELAGILRGVAGELDQPNELAERARQRQREDIQFRMQVEEHKRALDRNDMGARVQMGAMKRRLAGPPKMGPGQEGPPPGMMPRMGFGRGGMGRGPMGRMGPGPQGPRPGMPLRMGPGPEGPPPPEREQQMQREREMRGGDERERQMDRERKEREQMDRERQMQREREERGGGEREQMQRERKEREPDRGERPQGRGPPGERGAGAPPRRASPRRPGGTPPVPSHPGRGGRGHGGCG